MITLRPIHFPMETFLKAHLIIYPIEEDEEAAKVREERLKMYAAKKSNKPTVVAKSCVKLDVKPWDDETDLKAMEESVRSVQMEGLVWGQCKFIFFLQIYYTTHFNYIE